MNLNDSFGLIIGKLITGAITNSSSGGITGSNIIASAVIGAGVAAIGLPIGVEIAVTTVLGVFIPDSMYVNEDSYFEHVNAMDKAERLLKETIETNERLDDILSHMGGYNYDNEPCN